jgi:hypothetical protein
MKSFRLWWIAAAALVCAAVLIPSALIGRNQPTVEELKAHLASASVPDRPPLCIRIIDDQLDTARKSFSAADGEKAKAAVADIATFAEQARDYAIQSHKHEKQCEISIRKAARKLDDLKHTVSHDDQDLIQATIDRLQRVRDDLLLAMFPKVGKK